MGHWFEPIAEHLGETYLRYSFTKGTVQEIDFLVDALGLEPGMRVLDLGCGPGRHVAELARRGLVVVGVDISYRFLRIARDAIGAGHFVRADARALPLTGAFDAALSLCQGGFGLLGGHDDDAGVLGQIRSALAPGGRLALSAFNAYFQVRYLEHSVFDAATGINHEHTSVRNAHGEEKAVELHTTCYTPRELRLLLRAQGLSVEHLWSVEPGAYGRRPPDVESPELLCVARRSE